MGLRVPLISKTIWNCHLEDFHKLNYQKPHICDHTYMFIPAKPEKGSKRNAKRNAKLQNVVERPGRPQVTVGRVLRTMVHRNSFKLF